MGGIVKMVVYDSLKSTLKGMRGKQAEEASQHIQKVADQWESSFKDVLYQAKANNELLVKHAEQLAHHNAELVKHIVGQGEIASQLNKLANVVQGNNAAVEAIKEIAKTIAQSHGIG